MNIQTIQRYENYHRRKIDNRDVLKQKISLQIQKGIVETPPISVPNGLQVAYSSWYVPKPLHCCLSITSPTQDLFLAHYGAGPDNGVCIWNTETENNDDINRQKRKLKVRITNLVFVTTRNVFFASCTDLAIRSYGYEFQLYNKTQLHHSILSMIYDDVLDVVITGSVGIIQRWRIRKSLQDSPELVNETCVEDPLSGVRPWISFLCSYKEERRLIALTGTAIFILDIKTLEQKAYLENRHRYPMTVCVTFWPQQYLITGSEEGVIKIWNMYMNSFPYVGCFNGHANSIISLSIHPTDQLLISASTDSTIRFWRIETFHETYRYDVLDMLKDVQLVNAKRLYYATSNRMQLLEFNIFHTLFTLIGSRIKRISRVYTSAKPTRIFLIGEDGGARIVSPIHGNILTTAFPIITHKPITYHHDPIEERIYVLLEDGDVMVISTKSNPCKSIQLWRAFKDDDKVVSLGICYRNIENRVVPVLLAAHANGKIAVLRGEGLEMKPVDANRGIIVNIITCTPNVKNLCDFMTCNSEGIVTLWRLSLKYNKLSSNHISCIQDINFERKPDHIIIMVNMILLSMNNNLLFVKLGLKKHDHYPLEYRRPTKDECHLSNITELSSCENLSIFASCSEDGCLKIWDVEGCLLRELSFDNTLSGLCFSNNRGDILVGFQGDLHYVAVTEYLPIHYLKRLLCNNFPDDENEYCIPFDPILKFWYDPNRVECISVLQARLDPKPLNEYSEDFIGQKLDTAYSSKSSVITQGSLTNMAESQRNLGDNSIKSLPLKSHAYNLSLLRKQVKLVELVNTIREYKDTDDSDTLFDKLMESNNVSNHSSPTRPELDSSKKYWPCAPDGFIPNSIVRLGYEIKPPPTVTLKQWRPPGYVEDEISFIEDSDEEFDEARGWLSDDDGETIGSTFSNMGSLYAFDNPEDTKDKNAKSNAIDSTGVIAFPENSLKNINPLTLNTLESINGKTNSTPLKLNDQMSEEQLVPYPFDQYYKELWFPRNIGYEVLTVIPELTKKLKAAAFTTVNNMLQCIVKAHRFAPVTGTCLDELVAALFDLLDSEDGKIRHYAVKALCGLGINRKDVILKLIGKLNDPFCKVREEVKETLKEISGIVNAETLTAALKELGAFKQATTSNDTEVINSFKERILKRRDTLTDRLNQLYSRFNETDSKMTAWVEHMLQKSEIHSKRKARHIANMSKGETGGNNAKMYIVKDVPVLIYNTEENQNNATPELSNRYSDKLDYHDNDTFNKEREDLDDAMSQIRNTCPVIETSVSVNSIWNDISAGDNISQHNSPQLGEVERMTHLNTMLMNNVDTSVSEAIVTVAPHLGRRFKSLQDDQDLRQYTNEGCDNNIDNDFGKSLHRTTEAEVRNIQRWEFSPISQSQESTENLAHDGNQSNKEKESRKTKDESYNKNTSNILRLEHVALATAISALRGKRKNSIIFSREGLIGNEVLNDMTMLLRLLNQKNIKKPSTISKMMKQVKVLQKELQVIRGEYTPISEFSNVKNLVPLSIRGSMVPGVMGERIVSGLYVLPSIQEAGDKPIHHGVIKSIPARHGSETVTHKGYAKYGLIGYQWTTYAPSYDMGINCHHIQSNDKKSVHQKKVWRGEHVRRPKVVTERKMVGIKKSTSLKLNNRILLPKIKHQSKNPYKEKVLNPAPPPNTAEGVVR